MTFDYYIDDMDKSKIVNVKWCYQKNCDNGQTILYDKDRNHDVCPAARIYKGALKRKIATGIPIAFLEKNQHFIY